MLLIIINSLQYFLLTSIWSDVNISFIVKNDTIAYQYSSIMYVAKKIKI
jgi:hypothetical protein